MTDNLVVTADAEPAVVLTSARDALTCSAIPLSTERGIEMEEWNGLWMTNRGSFFMSYRYLAPARISALVTHLPHSQSSQLG